MQLDLQDPQVRQEIKEALVPPDLLVLLDPQEVKEHKELPDLRDQPVQPEHKGMSVPSDLPEALGLLVFKAPLVLQAQPEQLEETEQLDLQDPRDQPEHKEEREPLVRQDQRGRLVFKVPLVQQVPQEMQETPELMAPQALLVRQEMQEV